MASATKVRSDSLDSASLPLQEPLVDSRAGRAVRADRGATNTDPKAAPPPLASRHFMSGAMAPLYATGAVILLAILITSPLVYPRPQWLYRAGAATIMLAILLPAWRYSRGRLLSAYQNDVIQFLVVLAATGMCVTAQLWSPALEVSHGFVVVPLASSVMFRTIQASVAANVVIALAWASTWYTSGMPFNGFLLLGHLVYVPTLSVALSFTQQGALRQLAIFHENRRQAIQERHDAMRLVAEEASLRAKSEAELHRQHALLESILATVPDEIFVKDCQRRVILANRAYLDSMSLNRKDVLGKNTDELIPSNLVELSRQTDEAILRDGIRVHREITAQNEDGTERICDLEKLPLVEDGQITGILGIARNISERKAAERRLKQQEVMLLHASRLSSMGELVAGIAHEVNQPLYSILNYSKAVKNLLDGSLAPNLTDVKNWTEQILREATRGGKITKRLRSFVRRAETQRERASLTTIVREAIDFIAAEARRAHVQIEHGLEEDLPDVLVDRVQIQQVLVNLLKNAIEALEKSASPSGRIVISTRCVPEGVEVTVSDNGPGIPPHQADDVLEPFFTSKSEGLGLGLTISNTIIRSHESKLNYKTNHWGGATFQFTLKSAL